MSQTWRPLAPGHDPTSEQPTQATEDPANMAAHAQSSRSRHSASSRGEHMGSQSVRSARLQRTDSNATASSSRSRSSIPQPPYRAYGGGGLAFASDVDSSAPVISDRIYGDIPYAGHSADLPPRQRRRSSQLEDNAQSPGESTASYDAHASDDESEEHAKVNDHLHWARHLPWYKRPDERWLYPFVLLLAVGTGMIMAPKIELTTQLVCEEILGVESLQRTSSGQVKYATLWNLLPPPQERPPLSSQCRRSAEVEAASLALSLKVSLAMGILSAITTGFWGGLSDRHGRTVTLRIAMLGLTIGDLVYICLGLFPQSSLPFGKNLLVVSAAVEGLLGGLATLIASHQAYIAGVTGVGTRSAQLSRLTGAFFLGIGLGPALGGLISKHTHSTMAPFYFALAAHTLYLVTVTLILPESSSPESMLKAKEEHKAKMQRMTEQVAHDKHLTAAIRRTLMIMTVPLQPLAMLVPHRRDGPTRRHNDDTSSDTPATADSHISVSHVGRTAWDFNLTLVALAYFVETLGFGIMTPKIQYAMKTYDWDKEQLGYYLTYSSFTRVICLTAIIPLFIKWWHRPPTATALPQDANGLRRDSAEEAESTPLLDDEGRLANTATSTSRYGATSPSFDDASEHSFRLDPSSKQVERLWTIRARHLRQIHDSRFDRKLVLVSLFIASASYLALGLLASLGPVPYVVLSGVVCLGGAAPAGLSSLALSLLERPTDAGKFFAAWSVMSALSQTIVGPLLFSALFIRTVSTAPESIFYLGVALFIVSSILVSFVRVRHPVTLPPLPPRPPARKAGKSQETTNHRTATEDA